MSSLLIKGAALGEVFSRGNSLTFHTLCINYTRRVSQLLVPSSQPTAFVDTLLESVEWTLEDIP